MTKGVSGGIGLLSGVMGALSSGFLEGPMGGLIGGLLAGLPAGATAYSKDITSVETIRWSWSVARSRLFHILGNGLIIGLGVGLLAGLIGGLKDGLIGGLGVGLLAGLIGGLKDGLIVGQISTKTVPNEGIRRSARIALIAGMTGGLMGGTATWLMSRLMGGPISPLIGGLGAWLILGPIAGLRYGGRACLQHLVLRLLLVRNSSAPWRYVTFLDYAAERIVLRKAGGGYMFIHRGVQDYFAARHTESEDADQRDASHPDVLTLQT